MIGCHPSFDEGIPGCLLFFISTTDSYAFLNATMAPEGKADSAGGRSCTTRTGVGLKDASVGYDRSGPDIETIDPRDNNGFVEPSSPLD